ncbi:MAG TPA: glycosyltransferase [Acidimicrobiales bacterium]|nr:glycosyltransferase [Acidimicrobiales bacterium]
MTSLEHEVYLYASEHNEAACTELVTCITEDEQRALVPSMAETFVADEPQWALMNGRAIDGIRVRVRPNDFICLIGGVCQKPIADAFPASMCVEFGVGYTGVFSNYLVFESYAWMHTVYGHMQGAYAADGRFYDAVIPNYFEVTDFPFSADKDDYFLYMGRLTHRKGYRLAADICRREGLRLKMAGTGDSPPEGVEYLGVVGPEERGELMSRARGLLVPTLYIEPFGGVAVEAMLCGTPVITTDWGAFTETVRHGITGFRCRTFKEFREATTAVGGLDAQTIRDYAVATFSTEVIATKYEAYFERLLTLWGEGFYSD